MATQGEKSHIISPENENEKPQKSGVLLGYCLVLLTSIWLNMASKAVPSSSSIYCVFSVFSVPTVTSSCSTVWATDCHQDMQYNPKVLRFLKHMQSYFCLPDAPSTFPPNQSTFFLFHIHHPFSLSLPFLISCFRQTAGEKTRLLSLHVPHSESFLCMRTWRVGLSPIFHFHFGTDVTVHGATMCQFQFRVTVHAQNGDYRDTQGEVICQSHCEWALREVLTRY